MGTHTHVDFWLPRALPWRDSLSTEHAEVPVPLQVPRQGFRGRTGAGAEATATGDAGPQAWERSLEHSDSRGERCQVRGPEGRTLLPLEAGEPTRSHQVAPLRPAPCPRGAGLDPGKLEGQSSQRAVARGAPRPRGRLRLHPAPQCPRMGRYPWPRPRGTLTPDVGLLQPQHTLTTRPTARPKLSPTRGDLGPQRAAPVPQGQTPS